MQTSRRARAEKIAGGDNYTNSPLSCEILKVKIYEFSMTHKKNNNILVAANVEMILFGETFEAIIREPFPVLVKAPGFL